MSNYTAQELEAQLKPLSDNAFLRFFQKIWRWWLGVWYGFADKHPKGAKILYKVFFFIVFSEGVTIVQFLIMTFLPYAFVGLWDDPFVWPAVALGLKDAGGNPLNYAIFNEPVKFMVNGLDEEGNLAVLTLLASTPAQLQGYISDYGEVYQLVKDGELVGAELSSLQVAGLGNFIAFEIAVFIAQCVNFPLQRNITFRSHGNPYYQAMWYFIGWVGISIFVNALWGICNPLMMSWNWNEVVIGLIKTVITGGLSMVIFFPIFLIIFPDYNAVAKRAKAKYDNLVAAGAEQEKIDAALAKYEDATKKANLANAEKEMVAAVSQLNSKIMRYQALVKASNNEKNTEEQNKEYEVKVSEALESASEACDVKKEKEDFFAQVQQSGGVLPEAAATTAE